MGNNFDFVSFYTEPRIHHTTEARGGGHTKYEDFLKEFPEEELIPYKWRRL